MTGRQLRIDVLVEALAGELGLSIAPEWRDAVGQNLSLMLDIARNLDTVALPDEAEPATVFDAFCERALP
jgi:Protein of unknown function (DUF4089)